MGCLPLSQSQNTQGRCTVLSTSAPTFLSLMNGLDVPPDLYKSLILQTNVMKISEEIYYTIIRPLLDHPQQPGQCILLKGNVHPSHNNKLSTICAHLPEKEWHNVDWTHHYKLSLSNSALCCPHWPVNFPVPLKITSTFQVQWVQNKYSSKVGKMRIILPAVILRGNKAECLAESLPNEFCENLTSV